MFLSSIPYEPTGAQKRVINEIASDMSKGSAMHRLVAGDVGCGSGPAVTGLVGAAQTLKDGLLINMLFPMVMLILMLAIWIKEKKA